MAKWMVKYASTPDDIDESRNATFITEEEKELLLRIIGKCHFKERTLGGAETGYKHYTDYTFEGVLRIEEEG